MKRGIRLFIPTPGISDRLEYVGEKSPHGAVLPFMKRNTSLVIMPGLLREGIVVNTGIAIHFVPHMMGIKRKFSHHGLFKAEWTHLRQWSRQLPKLQTDFDLSSPRPTSSDQPRSH